MPCQSAMIDKPLTVSIETPVEDVLKQLKKAKQTHAVIVNEEGIVEGIFSARNLIKNLLPISIAVQGHVPIDVNLQAAPGVAKRLKKALPIAVSNVMERKINVILPDTPTGEGVNMLTAQDTPLVVVEDESLKFLGLITSESMLDDLSNL